MRLFQVFLTGMVPLAIRPRLPQHVHFNHYYVSGCELRRFADKQSWRSTIFGHLENRPEQLMLRLWQCVEANREDRDPPSLDDLVKPPTTPVLETSITVGAWVTLLTACFLLFLQCLPILVQVHVR